jgi:hypothetical protein
VTQGIDIYNIGLSIILKSSAIKNKNSINNIKDLYRILVFILKRYNSLLKTLIIIIRPIKKL